MEKEIKKVLFHTSPSIITDLRDSPMWFSFSRKIAEGYYDFSDGELEYIHEYKIIDGEYMSLEEVKEWCDDNDIDYDKMESEIRDNQDDVMSIEGLKELSEICDGFVHKDHSPLGKEDINALLIFNPSDKLELININSIKDDREDNGKSKGAKTDVGVVMGKKTELSESFLLEATIKKGDISSIFLNNSMPFLRDMAMVKSLLYLYDRQTNDEQISHSTNHHNNMGFTGVDANILSSFAKQVVQKSWLSDKQMDILRRKIIKYAGQMARVANTCKAEGRDGVIHSQMDSWERKNRPEYIKKGLI